MKRTVAAIVAQISAVALLLGACTPKPDQADGTVADFIAALDRGDFAAAADYTDNPADALSAFESSYQGLQAEDLDVTATRVTSSPDGTAQAYVDFDWHLPRDRELAYSNEWTWSKINNEWKLRWLPRSLHPQLGAGQHLELRGLTPPKASVVSADGALLLAPGTVYRVLAKGKTDNSIGIATRIAQALSQAKANNPGVESGYIPDVNPQELARTLADFDGEYSVATLTGPAGIQVAQDLADVTGVRVNEEADMINVDPSFAPEIMARVAPIIREDVNGSRGWEVVIANQNQAAIETLERVDPVPAPSIRVSLDRRLQLLAQEAVNLRPEMKAMMVVIRPSTGDIVAVAQTKRADEDGSVALMGQYPPGSTFKIITAAAGVMDQQLTPNSIVPCPSTMEIGSRIVTNYNAFSKGNVPMRDAFAASCNTSFADISAKLQPGQLEQVARQFGLGMDYEIPGLDTITGSVPFGDELVDRTEAGFGQGKDLASPFGMALVAATAASGRTPVPQLISGHETKVSENVAPPSPEAIAAVQEMMRAVVTSGTARGMRAGGAIAGKTGEAEIAGGSHAWFAGYRDDLAFATLIVLGGGSTAAVNLTDHFLSRVDGS